MSNLGDGLQTQNWGKYMFQHCFNDAANITNRSRHDA
jgi:hypothetical protein